MTKLFTLLIAAQGAVPAWSNCFICGEAGVEMVRDYYPLPDLFDDTAVPTCADFQTRLSNLDDAECTAELTAMNDEVQLYNYCGCDFNTIPDNICQVCDLSVQVPKLRGTVPFRDTIECDVGVDYLVSLTPGACSSGAYDGFIAQAKAECCLDYSTDLCSNGGTMANPDRVILGSGDGIEDDDTCKTYEEKCKDRGDITCTLVLDSEKSSFQLEAFCGCPGAADPVKCNVCDDDQTIKSDVTVPSVNLPCDEVLAFFEFATPSECSENEDLTGPLKLLCCEGGGGSGASSTVTKYFGAVLMAFFSIALLL